MPESLHPQSTDNSPFAARLSRLLVRGRWVLLPLALLLTVLAWPVSRQLEYDRSIETLYAGDDPQLLNYQESKSLFGGDELAIVAYTEDQLFQPNTYVVNPDAEKRLKNLSAKLSKIPGVKAESTRDPTSVPSLFLNMVPELFKGMIFGHDKKSAAVVLRLKPQNETEVPRSETIRQIRAVAMNFTDEYGFPTYIVGEPVQVEETFRYVEEDGRVLFLFSLIILGLVLIVLFRSVRWVMLPLLIVVITITWTEAMLVLSGLELSMVGSMLNSLVTIIGVATITHLAVQYREVRRIHERENTILITLTRLLPAIFWTCGTTAVGFAALLTSHVTPVKSFGLMMSIATTLVLIAVAGIVPGGTLIGRWEATPQAAPAEKQLVGGLTQLTRGVKRYPVWLAFAFLGIVLLAGVGFSRLQVETDFSKNFRDGSPIVQSLSFVEDPEHFAGAGSWEVNFPAPEVLTEDYMDNVLILTKRLRSLTKADQSGEITKVLSLTDATDAYRIKTFEPLESRLSTLKGYEPEFIPSFYNSEAGRMRIILRARERQPAEQKLKLISQVEQISQEWADEHLAEEFPNPQVKVTGLFVLLANLIQSLLRDQLVSFVIAALGIGGMMTLAFRSFRIGLIALLPNVFPIVVVIGGMGWLGLPINIATAMIASVSMGLTVDSSIHYFSGYFRARRQGLTLDQALEQTHNEVGRALVFANVALIAGFSVLTFSHFIPLVYFGILVSVAMIGGLIGNLLLLPLLLRWTARFERISEIAKPS
ncbi:MAG: MMPL family transporter [Planctomycetaceae bacterium]|nr:MMPL family transporter [Planctomycetaceae bacterium]